jgi:TolA-binding protein
MESKEQYIEKLQKQLREWDSELEELRLKSTLVKAELKDEYAEEMEDLESKRRQAEQKMKKIKEATAESWMEMKEGLERAWDELKMATKNAVSKYK